MAATWNNTDLLMVVRKKNDRFVLVNVKKKNTPKLKQQAFMSTRQKQINPEWLLGFMG